MTTAGDGDQTGSISRPDVQSDSVEALLAELLGPDHKLGDDDVSVEPETEPTPVINDAGEPLDELDDRDQNGSADPDPATGNENPTLAVPVSTDDVSADDVSADDVSADDVSADKNETATEAGEPATPQATPAPPPVVDIPVPVSQVASPIEAVPAQPSGRSFAKPLLFGVIGVLALFVLLVAVWAVDLARHQDTVMRGVEFAGTPLEGMDREDLNELFEQQRQDLAATPIDVAVGETTVTSDPVTLGMSYDREVMIDEAMSAGRTGFFLTRPVRWLGSLFGTDEIEPRFAIDADTTAAAADTVIASLLDQPVEPEMILDGDDRLIVLPGSSGITLSTRELVGRLPSVVEAGPPFSLELQAIVAEPEIDQQALESVAGEINDLTSEPIRIQVLDDIARIEPAMLKAWAAVETDGEPTWSFDPARVLTDLRPLFPTLGSEDQQARFSIVDGEPVIVPASETVVCCDEESVGRLLPGLQAPIPPDDSEEESSEAEEGEVEARRTIVLEPTVVGFDEGVAELESLGIVEEVSTFTTNHACCQNRVTNIQRFADLMQGVIIRPGESFSLNDHVGQRTTEKGFVADGAINLGVLEPQVGGGISQYATTFFNASFFAGLEFLEYQSHSLYISRYPRGREATISWRRPDLEVRNNTPYGILVWNEYTSTSITVTFYSTEHLEVEALPLRRSSERQCRVDITPRLITYPDGTQVEDTVFAVYRPGEGLDCAGNSTRPDLEPAAPTTQPDPEPDPEPQPEPQPEPEPEPDSAGGGDGQATDDQAAEGG